MHQFALDDLGIYGSDENAMKVAGHDLKGLMRYSGENNATLSLITYKSSSDIAGLSVPLIQLIDYRGFRSDLSI